MNNTNVNNDLIDADWITKYEKEELPFDIFYKDDVQNINIIFLYTNRENGTDSIFHVKKHKYKIDNSNITENDIYNLILNHKKIQNTIYYVKTIFKYNFTLDPINLTNYVDDDSYIKEHSSSFSITFNKSIKLFENLNSLYFIMEPRHTNNKTRKIYINTQNKTRRKY
jgi:hypothetical protein